MSIRIKITILFLASFLLMGGMTYWVQTKTIEKNKEILIERYLRTAKTLLPSILKDDKRQIQNKLETLGIKELKQKQNIKKDFILYHEPLSYGEILIFSKDRDIYLLVEYLGEIFTLYDTTQQDIQQEIQITYLFFIADIALLLLIYLLVLAILSPLQKLSQTMKHFSKGNLDARLQLSGNDEIATLSKDFNLMAKRLQQALEAKEELLRYVGHELKTPISKGKFALESIDDTPPKTIIKEVFDDLDALTTAILTQKRIDEEKMNKQHFKASTLIAQALSKLTLQEKDVTISLGEFEIFADLHYMSLALKNLIENALKYSKTLPIEIKADNRCIYIINYAKALDKPLSYYTQPFTRATNNKSGFGLGLNIVQKIVDKHGFIFNYKHISGKNEFFICFN